MERTTKLQPTTLRPTTLRPATLRRGRTSARTRAALVPVLALVLVAVAAGCSGGASTDAEGSAVAASGTEASGGSSADAGTTAPAPAAPADEIEPSGSLAGLPRIELLGPAGSEVGPSPVFSWTPVPGAEIYHLSVLGASGPLWGWEGETTEVRYGGYDAEPGAGFGAVRLDQPGWWSLVAYTATGEVVGVSSFRAVSPDAAAPSWQPGAASPSSESTDTTETSDTGEAGDTEAAAPADACGWLQVPEVEVFLAGPVAGPGEATSGRGGKWQGCTWTSAADEFLDLDISLNAGAEWTPEVHVEDTPVPVDGLGEQSFATMDWGMRVGFVRNGFVVMVTSMGSLDEALPRAIEIARLIDTRIQESGLQAATG